MEALGHKLHTHICIVQCGKMWGIGFAIIVLSLNCNKLHSMRKIILYSNFIKIIFDNKIHNSKSLIILDTLHVNEIYIMCISVTWEVSRQ